MVLAQLFLRQRQRGKDGAFGAARTEAGGARRHHRGQALHLLVEGDGLFDGLGGGLRTRDFGDFKLAAGGLGSGHRIHRHRRMRL
ncbi:hypothetical protein D3C78_1682590 [compost metagenome]